MFTKFLTAGAGLAALAAAAPATAQYGHYGNNAQFAVNQCTAAVQNRLSTRAGIGGILGSLAGVNSTGRVLSVTQVDPRSNTVRVRGLASSGRMAYNPNGYGYYGAVGSQYAAGADLSFKCDVDYRGRIRDIDINRR